AHIMWGKVHCTRPSGAHLTCYTRGASSKSEEALERLGVVGDAVDDACVVVGNEEGSVGHDEDVGGTAPWSLSLQPAGCEWFVGDALSVLHAHQRHAIADLLAAVP